jgi:lysophospholipase L1-like esterase
MIIGDSIAVGTSYQRKECVSYSQGGINSAQWNTKYKDVNLSAKILIISLGTNDHKSIHTFKELSTMRAQVSADKVYWIMPPCNDVFCKPHVNEWVKIIAESRGDVIIKTTKLQKDAIHPSMAGYKELAQQTQEK